MKAIILAGGFGTRLSEETNLRPKPMVSIGGMPIIWHIMKIYSSYGINEFIICCGYKGYMIKEYFANYFLHNSDITFHMDEDNRIEVHNRKYEPWKVTLVDTGQNSMTGGRLKRVQEFIDDDIFCFTYGDGLSNINLNSLINYHKSSGREVTLTAVKPPGRFGALSLGESNVLKFIEKPEGDNTWINGGFFVCNYCVFDRICGDNIIWEEDILPVLADEGKLAAFKHKDFWQPMDTLRDKNTLQTLWDQKQAPWKNWN